MKKEIFSKLAIIAILCLFAACNSEEAINPEQDVKLYSPVVNGLIGEFIDENQSTTTKAGVVEENLDYASKGEQFYWMEGDTIKLLFYKNGNLQSTPTELLYTALAPEGKSNKCEFTKLSTGGLEEGSYTVYALYPANKWYYDSQAELYRIKTMSYDMTQVGVTSRNLGEFMYMKAKTENVKIGPNYDGTVNSFDLNFKQLASMVRFTITDSNYEKRSMKINKIRMILYCMDNIYAGSDQFFPMNAYLKSIDDEKLVTIQDNSRVHHLTLNVGEKFPTNNDGKYTFFMPVLPTREPILNNSGDYYNEWMSIEVVLQFSYPNSNIELETTKYFGTFLDGLGFKDDVSFLKNGFKAGKSYYFDLKID